MTKKHFIAFAKYIAALTRGAYSRGEIEHLAAMVVTVATQDNPKFDSEKFRKACGL